MKISRLSLCLVFFAIFFACGDDIASEEPSVKEFEFTKDWTTKYADSWNKYLAPFKGRANLKILEVGTFEGRSAIWFLNNIATHPSAEIVCIDVFRAEGLEERFDNNIKLSNAPDKVTKIKNYSQRALRGMQEDSFDIIYVDGCHSAWCVYQDLALSWPLLKRDGILIVDDYPYPGQNFPGHQKSKTAIDPFLIALQQSIEVLEKDQQVIVRKTKL